MIEPNGRPHRSGRRVRPLRRRTCACLVIGRSCSRSIIALRSAIPMCTENPVRIDPGAESRNVTRQ